jgi:LysR family transcriptional regulator (chromosome initiation inhibitor)
MLLKYFATKMCFNIINKNNHALIQLMTKLDYKQLEALTKVVELQSFELAATKLFITQSAVSQRIKQLEESIGQPVLIRSQPLEVTQTGQALLKHYKMIEQLENELLPAILPEHPNKPIKVSLAVNADSLATWLIQSLSPVLQHELIELDLIIEHEERTLEKLKSGEAIAAVTTVAKPLTGYRAIKLGQINYLLVASKSFQKRYFARGVNRESLKMAPAVSFDHKDDMHVKFIAQHFQLNADEYYCHSVRSAEAFVTMAKQGVAYCLLPELQIKHLLARGELVSLCADKQLVETLYWHYWILAKGVYQKMSNQIISYAQQVLTQ